MAQEAKDSWERKGSRKNAQEAEDKARKWQKEFGKEEARSEDLEKQLTEAVKNSWQWQRAHEKCEAELKEAKKMGKKADERAQ